jgi:DNA-binding NtrC family response regulator
VNPIRVVVISTGTVIREILAEAFCPAQLCVIEVRPGPGMLEMARRTQPHVAIIDSIHERLDAAELEIAFLKDLLPDIQIIVLSQHSSLGDARIVEQGVFYYMAAPPGEELVRIVEAAGHSLALNRLPPVQYQS